ncbi:hypothetical protein F9230_07540 [Acinetobacter johnsonii]|uniref:hypothetical protein n=1 Tax=Acinetobacter johnsonii TaxID=40214 RepID=UPI001F3BAA3D|nr:hypothetical protein [Acinetobacter johnsonii]UJA04209.1 hypothetical protein F9230_07540 [Acinetobacter johnsonii]
MRFEETVFYKIDDLKLDQENYRFGVANSQEDCINLIYKDSPESFENLLNDIINNNIGDYPLVYITPNGEKIVLDGNRRISILKIINNPELAPSKRIADIVNKIDKTKLLFDLKKIGCFVSTDKQKILKTVYERHAAGKGISRIQWSAFATAKFRYDAEIEDNDWRAIAILLHIISFDEYTDNLIKKPNFSFEVFRRMMRYAYSNGYLHFDIFNEDKSVINSESEYLNCSIELIKQFVKAIDNNEVGLSRGKNYASESFLTQYFLHHFTKVTDVKPPRKKRVEKIKKQLEPEPTTAPFSDHILEPDSETRPVQVDPINKDEPLITSPVVSTPLNVDQPDISTTQVATPFSVSPQIMLPLSGISPVLEIIEPTSFLDENADLINSLNNLSIQKFSLLYQSLTQLNIKKYPILAVIATWSFLDSLPRVAGWEGTDFTSYYNGQLKSVTPNISKDLQTDIRHSLAWFHLEGNCNKHSAKYVTLDYKEFIKHFNNIQTFLARIITQKIIPNKTMANTQ